MATGLLPALLIFLFMQSESLSDHNVPAHTPFPCAYSELPCESGQCVSRTSWCDGPTDCFDGSDETYCRTSDPTLAKDPGNINDCNEKVYFRCDSGLCIPKAGRCNDMPDCKGGEDEENCDYLYETSDDIQMTTPPPAPITSPPPPPPLIPKLRGDTSWLPKREDVLAKSLAHVIDGRDEKWGWGHATPQIVSALALADDSYFEFESHDGAMTRKQLEVQLALDLMRNAERPLRVYDLAHYVHALVATCIDPRNFHGVNVLRLLKKSMARRQSRGLFVSPLAHLALCNAGDLHDLHIRKLKNMAYRRSEEPRWLDVQTYALLVISCRTSHNSSGEWTSLRKDVATNLSEWQQDDGSFGSVHSTALALQALIAAQEPGTRGAIDRALTHLLTNQEWQGGWGGDTDTYYVLPALHMRSLASLHSRKCRSPARNTQATEGARSDPSVPKKKPKTTVHYSLWIGGERNELQTITLRLPRHPRFLQVMDAAQKVNPLFKYETLTTAHGTSVNKISGRTSDIERSTYWTLYRKVPLPFRPQLANVTATVARLKLFGAKRWTKDLRKLHPRDGEHLAFWYKPYL